MILVLLTGLVLMRESRQEPLEAWDNWWADFLAMSSPHDQQTAPVVLVQIDDESLKSHPWPWNPLDYSLFFQAILPHQPGVLAIDEVLDWDRISLPEGQAQKLPQYEKILRENILRAPKMLLAAQLGFPEDPQVAPPWQEVPLLRNVTGDLVTVPEFPIVERQPAEDYRLSSTIGFINLPPVHERFNSVPLIFRHRGQVVPAFALQAAMLWARLTPDEVEVVLGSHINLGRKRRIPIDSRGRMRVDFGTPRNEFSFDDLLLASEQMAANNPPIVDLSKVQGKLVLLSRTDAKAKKIPFAARRDGSAGELFAAAIATMQNQSFIKRAPLWTELVVLAGLVVISALVPRWSRWTALAVGFVTLAAYVMISMAVLTRWLIWLPGAMPLGTVVFFVIFRIATPELMLRPKKPVIL
ncbi:MAG: adenylate cyclase [Chthoniobacter sp.]|nr:adenylate cyclase [Chthoniobacter sp.]